jgi:tetratricopeptide (TPR) repeat protein
MVVTIICARLLYSLRFLITLSLVTLPWVTASRCLGQEKPPQTEEEKQARQDLNQGVQAFKNGQYQEAERYFAHAKQLDPRLLNARLYLATAYASEFIPGASSEQNKYVGRQAIDEFKDALAVDPENISAIDGVGSLLFQMAGTPYDAEKLQESKSYHQKHIELKPNDPELYYWIGVIDWTLSFRANGELRASYDEHSGGKKELRDEDPLPNDLRQKYVREFGAAIDEGIESLKHAIELRPEYDDAMAYLNLLYRRKADTAADQNERDELLKMADDLVDKVKDIKQKRAQTSSQR